MFIRTYHFPEFAMKNLHTQNISLPQLGLGTSACKATIAAPQLKAVWRSATGI
jgi:hypothetical protein